MDSIHPPCEVQFFRRDFGAGRRHGDHDPDADGEDDNLSDSSNRSPLSSPPNSPLRLSPCSETRGEAHGNAHGHRHQGKTDSSRFDVHGRGGDDRTHRLSSSSAREEEPPVPSLLLPSHRESTHARGLDRDVPMVARIHQLTSTSSSLAQSGMGNPNPRLVRESRLVEGRLALGGDEQQHADDENLGATGPRSNHPSAQLSSRLAMRPRRIEPNLPGAFNTKYSQSNPGVGRENHGLRHDRDDGSRVGSGRASALPFEDEESSYIEDEIGALVPALVLAATPQPAIDVFPSLDEDDDAAGLGEEIVAAPTDEGPSLLPPAPVACANGDGATLAAAPAPSAATAGPWMSFHMLKQRVLDAVSPVPPVAIIEDTGDNPIAAAEPRGDSARGDRSIADADEPPPLPRRPTHTAGVQRLQRSASSEGSPMHPMDERDELQSIEDQIDQDPCERPNRLLGALTSGTDSVPSEPWTSKTPAPGRLDTAVSRLTTLVTPPHLSSALFPAGVARKSNFGLPFVAPRVAINTPSSSRGVEEMGPAKTPSPAVVSPPQQDSNALLNPEKIAAVGSKPTWTWDVLAVDTSSEAPSATGNIQARGGWWVEDELSKREQQRKLAGHMTRLSVAERIAALNYKIEVSSAASSCSQPSSPDCPNETKGPANCRIAPFSSATHVRKTTPRLEPPGSDFLSTSAASPETLSIVGVSSPPTMKRLNDSFESIVRGDENMSLPSRSSRTGEDFRDAYTEQPLDLTESSECLQDPEHDSSHSLIASLEPMIQDMETSAARKTSPTSNRCEISQNLPLPKTTSATPIPTAAQLNDSFARGIEISVERSSVSTTASHVASVPVTRATGIDFNGMPPPPYSHLPSARRNPTRKTETSAIEASSDRDDLESLMQVSMPFLVKPLDSELGVPKGDVMVSLLSKDSSWSCNVTEAVWRCRSMRRNNDTKWLKEKSVRQPSPLAESEVSLRDCRESQSPNDNQADAMEHLRFDELDAALRLYEEIHRSYDDFFAQAFEQSASKSPKHRRQDVTIFKVFAGQAFHNIATIKLLQGEYADALTFFERATLNRASSCGTGHPDHISSLVRMALCHFALENFASSQAELEEALAFLRGKKCSIAEYRQLAEVLNNLGCLSYMCGRIEMAISYLEESLDLQARIAEQALYIGSRFSCHSGTLNATITKGNLGLLALATGDPSMSITAFEASLRDQQLLLRDANVALLGTMEHLAIANQISGNRDKALQLLRRMLHMQIDAYGPDDERSVSIYEMITNLLLDQEEESLLRSPQQGNAHAAQTCSKFRPFSLMRKRHAKAS